MRTGRIVVHLVVAVLVSVMIGAGVWQLDRHGDRADRNDLIEARVDQEPADITDVAPPESPASVGHDQQFRPVRASGTWMHDDEVLVRNRTNDGAPGFWVLTPLMTDEGWAVVVNRGWIPVSFDPDSARPGTEAPPGPVVIHGWVQPSRGAEGLQRADPSDGVLTSLGHPDVVRLGRQLDYPVSPVVVQQRPADTDGLPIALALPALDGGPHLSYAVQWFVFAAIAGAGYPLILRRANADEGPNP